MISTVVSACSASAIGAYRNAHAMIIAVKSLMAAEESADGILGVY